MDGGTLGVYDGGTAQKPKKLHPQPKEKMNQRTLINAIFTIMIVLVHLSVVFGAASGKVTDEQILAEKCIWCSHI
jgi:hypothetical protein